MKKIPKNIIKNNVATNNKFGSFSSRALRQIFILLLLFLITPLCLFNLLWIFDAQLLLMSAEFLNLLRFGLLIGFFSLIFQDRSRKTLKSNLVSGFIFISLIAIVSQINGAFSNRPDTNSDSLTSHLLLTEAISNGWNPLNPDGEKSKLVSSSSLLIQTDLSEGRIETGVGFQTIQAFCNLLFGVESTYVFVNLLFLSLTVVKLLEIFELFGSNSKFRNTFAAKFSSIGVILLFLMSPIVTQQVNSAYTDLAGYCLLTCCLLICTRNFADNRLDKYSIFSFVILVILTPSIKLQLVALMIPLILAFLYIVTTRSQIFKKASDNKDEITFSIRTLRQPRVLISILALLSLMYFPIGMFVTNIFKGKLPLHSDKSWVASTWSGSIPEFMELNGVERVQTILGGRTSLNPSEILVDGLFSIPTRSERNDAGFLDSRVAGFGPLWGDLLVFSSISALVSILLVFYLCRTQKNKFDFQEIQLHKRTIYFSAYLLFSYSVISVLMPLSFMARYYPQYMVMAFLSIYIISVAIRIVSSHIFFNLILKIAFQTSLLLIILNFQIVVSSYLEIKGNSNKLIQQMKVERLSLQNSGEFRDVKYYFRNKTGLILATTGEISLQSFSKNATLECRESDKLVLITDETGLCGIS